MDKVNLREMFGRFRDHWSPKVDGELNGQQVKLVKSRGEFVWHKHDREGELFLVVSGRFRLEFRDREVWLEAGEFLIVPRGVEHRAVAEDEVHVLLFEPATTLTTGDTAASTPNTRSRSRMRSFRSQGSVRGDLRTGVPYSGRSTCVARPQPDRPDGDLRRGVGAVGTGPRPRLGLT
jgi:mannose-6-phosphate isomerase-like protein (cupin superfamily)